MVPHVRLGTPLGGLIAADKTPVAALRLLAVRSVLSASARLAPGPLRYFVSRARQSWNSAVKQNGSLRASVFYYVLRESGSVPPLVVT